jgi:orotidine-5'-phosphate decarboxylase
MSENKTLSLSTKAIPPNERLIFALDVPSAHKAKQMVETLGDSVNFYKLGLELFMAGGYFELIEWLNQRGKKIFADLKFYDVPQTVESAVRQLAQHEGVTFATVHAADSLLTAACRAKRHLNILAVTVLTSLDQGDLDDLGFQVDIKQVVLSRARRALQLGCDGVISSGLEAFDLRQQLGEQLLIVTPGIRPVQNTDDQKRTVNIEQAFRNGADYIVVGRPIKDHHGFNTPRDAALSIQQRIQTLFTTH